METGIEAVNMQFVMVLGTLLISCKKCWNVNEMEQNYIPN